MNTLRTHHWCSWFLAAVFLTALIGKALSPWGFRIFVEGLSFLPSVLRALVFIAIPSIEMALVVCLVFRPVASSLIFAIAVLFVFTLGWVGVTMLMGDFRDCPCFGGAGTASHTPVPRLLVIARNLLLMVIALVGFASSVRSPA